MAEYHIFEGNIDSTEELHELDIFDVLVEESQFQAAIVYYCQRGESMLAAERAVYRASRVSSPTALCAVSIFNASTVCASSDSILAR
jgi:DSF synthase